MIPFILSIVFMFSVWVYYEAFYKPKHLIDDTESDYIGFLKSFIVCTCRAAGMVAITIVMINYCPLVLLLVCIAAVALGGEYYTKKIEDAFGKWN